MHCGPAAAIATMLNTKSRRIALGLFLLLVVDVIWVLSSELTKVYPLCSLIGLLGGAICSTLTRLYAYFRSGHGQYLYENESFDKPFFCTYFKTSMFTLYLLVIGLLSPWKDTCEHNANYTLIEQTGSMANDTAAADRNCAEQDDDSDATVGHSGGGSLGRCTGAPGSSSLYANPSNSLSDSTFVPIKPYNDDDEVVDLAGGGGSRSGPAATAAAGTADGDNTSSTDTDADGVSIKSVRFNRLAEVREMSAHEANEALLARLSYAASLRMRRQRSHHKTARTALLFCMLWFLANYLFQLALEPDETALVTLLSSTASLFTLVLAAAWPSGSGDRLTLSKAAAVVVSCAGVLLVTVADVTDARMSRGIVLALMSALCYAAYLVLVKHKSAVEERINIPLFFGFVGLWNLLLLWPVFFVLNFTQIETFELPNRRQWLLLLLNGLVGTVLSEALWLWACFLTSSIIGTIAMTLQIPLSMLFDVLLKGKTFPLLFYAGSVPMCASLVAVALLLRHDDSDPLLRFCKIVYRKVCHCRRPNVVRIVDLDDEQQESLIDSYEEH